MNASRIKTALIRNRLVKYLYYALRPGYVKRTLKEYFRENLDYEVTPRQLSLCTRDFMHFRWKYQGGLETDFLGTQMYRKSDFVREESFADKSRYLWRDSIQDRALWDVFLDKRVFYREFSDYLNRKWMLVNADTSGEAVADFVAQCGGRAFAKLPVSCGGKDVFTVTRQSVDELLALAKENDVILEEPVKQCEELYSFSGGAVNTVRIITIVDWSGTPHVARCVFRIGRSSADVDNFASGGMAAYIDVETGIIYSTASTKKGRQYILHPDTGKQIVGFQIPDWEKYKEFALTLASRFPTMRYVGWDIVRLADGRFCVIEGNKDAGVDVMESNSLYGLKPVYTELLNRSQNV